MQRAAAKHQMLSEMERRIAARVVVKGDKARKRKTPGWIVALAEKDRLP
jgi:hypothetical protein